MKVWNSEENNGKYSGNEPNSTQQQRFFFSAIWKQALQQSMSNTISTVTTQLARPAAGLESYLTGNPRQSLFSAYDYRQHTPYAKNATIVPFNEKVGYGKTISAVVPYVGDLVQNIRLYFRLPALPLPIGSTYVGYTNTIGYAMIESVEMRIGEQVIISRSDVFLDCMDYLQTDASKQTAAWKAVGRYDTVNVLGQNAMGPQDIYVGMNLWIEKRPASALPLLKLGGIPVRVVVKLKPFASCVTYDGLEPPIECPPLDAGLLVDYYVLSDDEKQDFHEEDQHYLIEQWQVDRFDISPGMSSNRFSLDFNLSVKELVFCFVEQESEDNNDFFNYGQRDPLVQGGEFISTFSFFLDGKERIEKLPESYARMVLPKKYHTFAGNRNIYTLPFAEYPEVIAQPSGTCNMSGYDSVELGFEFVNNLPATRLYVAAISYNRLVISESGVTLEFLS